MIPLDFNHGGGSPATVSDLVNDAIDAALLHRRASEPVRTYLGASAIGDPCDRKLQYSYARLPVDPERRLTARALRIFDTGHVAEDVTAAAMGPGGEDMFRTISARWLKDAGFQLETKSADGRQFGFSALQKRFAGHIDGKIISGPSIPGLRYPCGWEHKALNTKNWTKIKKVGLREASPVYYGQIQIYEGYLDLPQFLFTALNKNTQELHHEVIEFDPRAAQDLSDRAVWIIQHTERNELLPRIAGNPDYYLCKFCDWKSRCWGEDGGL